MKYNKESDEIISLGRLMWDKDLVAGYNGNISLRVDEAHLLMTGRGTCLGMLGSEDLSLVTLDGRLVAGAEPTSERLLHFEIYRNFPGVSAVVHTHTACINAFFLNNIAFHPRTLEAKAVLGEVYGVDQATMNVVDAAPVIERLGINTVVALRRHGVVAVGNKLFDCFAKIQILEEQLWVEALGKIFSS